jgi:nicotinate phosphoribosyltransferase
MLLSALSTDLYELTMIGGYYAKGVSGRATFDLFVRQLPPTRNYLVAAGLEQALDFLESLRFTRDEIDYLRTVPALASLPREFFDEYLTNFRFTGDVAAIEEGTPVFAQEPLMRVTAPLAEAQLVETALISEVMFPTAVASRASRVVEAAAGRSVMEFGARRAHGIDAGIRAARAAYLAGFDSSSIVEAGKRFGIPLSGTMAHSWVMAFGDEPSAFRAYADLFGERAVFILDTYDALAAARIIAVSGLRPRAVRLDSGDLVTTSREVRRIFDEYGRHDIAIVASGDLDELRIAEIVTSGAPISGFGVGTAVSTSSDAPALSGVYKLAEIERGGEMVAVSKKSPGKRTYPGCKQVWRTFRDGQAVEDVLTLASNEPPANARPLLIDVMRNGITLARPSLDQIRQRCRERVAQLPHTVRRVIDGRNYPVQIRIAS